MPKQTLNIEGFHGGLNTNADPRDIGDNQSPDLLDVAIDSLGKLKVLGTSSTTTTSNTLQILPNRGLFILDADRKVSDNAESNESLIIAYDNGGNSFDINDSGGWSTNEITLNTNHPVFYSADGILRVGDGGLTQNDGRWYGYISDRKFNGLLADSGNINDWIDSTQNIKSPTNGKCLISDPQVGSDGDTINSSNSEYDGNIADGSGDREVVEASSVNLRVGFQHNEVFQNTQTDWERGSDSPFQGTLSEPAESVIYPVLGNNVLLMQGSATSTFHRLKLDNTDSGTELEFQITDDSSLAFGVNISTVELNKLSYILLSIYSSTIGTGSDIQWRFNKDDLIEFSTNILVCSKTNVHLIANNADFNETYDKITIFAYQEDGNSSNDAPDIYYHMPIKVKNPQLQGFQPGLYNFHYTYLYDESKQESLPFKFASIQGTSSFYDFNKLNIVGAPILFNFDAYVVPYNLTSCTTNVSNNRIDSVGHGLLAGTAITFSDISNAVWTNKNTDIFFVSSENLETDTFRISTTYANAIAGTSISFTGTNDSSGPHYHIYDIDKRIVGSRLYYKVDGDDNYFLIGELDFIENGFKFFPDSDALSYEMVNSSHPSAQLAKSSLVKKISPDSANTIDTFKTINGFSTEVKSLDAKYKTAVVHGRRVYIGNVKKDGVIHSDRMIKSRVNRFDTFPSGMGVVDVAIRDGESIVKLEAFADRILQFKQKSLYVINVSENVDFLEDVYRNKGCVFDYHVTKTDYGIAWFNIFGVYFFDGKNVSNFLEKDGIRLIDDTTWKAFITDGEDGSPDDTDMSEAHIGYVPKKRHLLIKNRNKDIFIYDFVLRAWTKGSGRIIIQRVSNNSDNTNMTNFALDGDEDLIYITNDASSIATWNPDPADSANFVYETKDIDFGQPSVRKKIHKVYLSYKGDARKVEVKYGVNGLSPSNNFCLISSDGSTTATGATAKCLNFSGASNSSPGTDDWLKAELKPGASIDTFNNINSFRLKVSADGSNGIAADFEINDITIVYRLKNVK